MPRHFVQSPTVPAALLAAYFALALSAARDKSPAYDELFHVTGGYSFWIANDYRIHPTNGNVIQRWLTLPLLAARPALPARDRESWHRPTYFGYHYSRQFFYESGNDPHQILAWARGMNVLLGVAAGAVVFAWSRRLFGRRGGIVSLALYCTCPTLLAHGALATSDMAAALFFTLAVLAWWRCLERLSLGRLAVSGFACAGLFLVKFSAPLFLVMAAVLATVRIGRGRPWPIAAGERTIWLRSRGIQAVGIAGLVAVHAAFMATLIWTCYGFRHAALDRPVADRDQLSDRWTVVLDGEQHKALALIDWANRWRLLPEAYLFGAAHTLRFSEERPAFLRGQIALTGWWYFFPYCFAVKTPLATLILLLVACAVTVRRVGRRGAAASALMVAAYRTAPLWVLFAVYWWAAIRSPINLGPRHLLPVYPATFVLAGAAALGLRSWFAPRGMLLACLLAYQAAAAVWHYPHYLAYFNPLVGGPSQGYRHLVDSSLDWGQDLPGLARWLDKNQLNGSSPVKAYHCYFGVAPPAHYGVAVPHIRAVLERELSPDTPFPLKAGVYCISATTLAGPNEEIPRWTAAAEEVYRELQKRIGQLRAAGKRFDDVANGQDLRRLFGNLQFSRLLAYLRGRKPDETINYSILVFRLTDADLRAALDGPVDDRRPFGW